MSTEQIVERPPSPSESEGSEDPKDRFIPAQKAIDFHALTSTALKVRRDFLERQNTSELSLSPQELSCSVQLPPKWDASHVVYMIAFSDGVIWVARIRGNAVSSFGPLDAREMIQTIRTTSLIRSKTKLPLLEVYSWDTTPETIGVPFSLESFIEGRVLSNAWDDKSWASEERKLKVLRELAKVMSQLAFMKFDKIGALHFDSDEKFSHVGPSVEWDSPDPEDEDAEPWRKLYEAGPWSTLHSCLTDDWDAKMKDEDGPWLA